MGAKARHPARLAVAAPPSTQANSNATSASARFRGPAMNPPCSGSIKTAVMPDWSKASNISALAGVHSWVLRPPCATKRATVPRATARTDRTSIWRPQRSAKPHWIWRAASEGRVRSISSLWRVAVDIDGVLSVGDLHQSVKPATHRSVISVTSRRDVVETDPFAASGFGAKKWWRFTDHKRKPFDGNVAKKPTVFARIETP